MSDMSSFVFSEFLGPSDAEDAAAAPMPSFGDGMHSPAFASNPYVSVPGASVDDDASVDHGEMPRGVVAASEPFMQALAGVPAPDSPLSPAFYLDLLGSPFPSPGLPSPGFPGCPESPGCGEGRFVGSVGFASQQQQQQQQQQPPPPPYGLGVTFPLLDGVQQPGVGYLPAKPGASPEPPSPAFSSKASAARGLAKSKFRGASAGPDGDYTGKVFACTVPGCGKPFKRAEHLKRHYKSVHTTEKPFQCPVETCLKKFSRSDNLNQHIRTHKDDSLQQLHVEAQEFQAPVLHPGLADNAYLNMTPFDLTFDMNHTHL